MLSIIIDIALIIYFAQEHLIQGTFPTVYLIRICSKKQSHTLYKDKRTIITRNIQWLICCGKKFFLCLFGLFLSVCIGINGSICFSASFEYNEVCAYVTGSLTRIVKTLMGFLGFKLKDFEFKIAWSSYTKKVKLTKILFLRSFLSLSAHALH